MGLCKGEWEPKGLGCREADCSSEHMEPWLPGSCILIGVHGEAVLASHQARLSLGRSLHITWFVPSLFAGLCLSPYQRPSLSPYLNGTPSSLSSPFTFIVLRSVYHYPTGYLCIDISFSHCAQLEGKAQEGRPLSGLAQGLRHSELLTNIS